MAKRPPPGTCVHCLEKEVDRTWDHVLPQAWYPVGTPDNLHKWQIPSCHLCNRDYGKLESDLLVRLAFCLDPTLPETTEIVKRALRSLNPKYGKNKRDSAARSALAARLSKELLNGRQIHREAVYPGFEEKWGRSHAQGLGIKVPAESFRRFSEKIVRGVYFVDGERLIEPPYVIEFFALSDQGAKPIQDLVERYGREMSLGTAIVVRIAEADEDRMCSLIEISIWGKFKMYCSVDLDNDSIT